MVSKINKSTPSYIKSADELGHLIRAFRKSRGFTLEKVSGLSNLGMRFISELERGKETVELGKVLQLLNNLGLEVIVQPRGTESSKNISVKDLKE